MPYRFVYGYIKNNSFRLLAKEIISCDVSRRNRRFAIEGLLFLVFENEGTYISQKGLCMINT
jgi:hypothetical protein